MQPIQTSPDERGIPWALEPTANQRDSSKRLRDHPTWQGRQMEAHTLHNLNWALSDRFSSSWLREINNWYYDKTGNQKLHTPVNAVGKVVVATA